MTHTDLLRQALDALELQEPAVGCPREREHWKRTAMPTMDALRAALAQPAPASIVPKWTNEEIEQGRVGIRWVRDDGVYGRPGMDDVLKYIKSRWPDQPAPAVQVVLRQPNLFAADPAAPAVNCEWTNCPRRVGDVCCNDRPAAPAVPAVDCRTCARCYSTKGRGVFGCDSVVACTNGDRYQPLPPVRLWRAA